MHYCCSFVSCYVVICFTPAEGGRILNMTANGWFQIGFYLLVIFFTDQTSWNIYDSCVQPGKDISRSGSAAD